MKESIIVLEPISSALDILKQLINTDYDPWVFITKASYEYSQSTLTAMGWRNISIIDALTEACILESIHKLNLASSLKSIIPGFEYYVPLAHRVMHQLELPSFPEFTLECIRLKNKLRERLDCAGIDQPRYQVITDPLESTLDFPIVVKPTNLAGSIGVRKILNQDELIAYFDAQSTSRYEDAGLVGNLFLAEEYIDGDEYSVEGLICPIDQTTTIVSITRKILGPEPDFIETGHMVGFVSDTFIRNSIEAYVLSIIKAMDVHFGPFHAEIRLDADNKPKIIEIGFRLPGDHIPDLIELSYGINMAKSMIDAYTQKTTHIAKQPPQFSAIKYIQRSKGFVVDASTDILPEHYTSIIKSQALYAHDDIVQSGSDYRSRVSWAIFSSQDKATILDDLSTFDQSYQVC